MAGPIQVQKDNLDTYPSVPREAPPWEVGWPRLLDWRTVGVLCATALVFFLVLYWLFGQDVREWLRYGEGSWWLRLVLFGAAVFGALAILRSLLLVKQPGGFRVPFWSVARVDAREVIRDTIGVHNTFAGTAFRSLAGSYTLTYPTKIEQPIIDALPALPAPEDTIALTPDSEWLRWVDRAPHLLLAGKTDAGKTTMATALLSERILAGDQILVLDPHYQPGKWFGVQAVSGIPAILETLPALISELEARYKEFRQGKQTEEFERLTVLIDEVPAIVEQCIEMTASGRPKVTDWRWRRFAKRLGSEARKVRISVILLSQSTLVQDLMINVQMKENFTRIGLGDQARPLLAEEPLPKRKQALFDLLRGQAHPAAMEYRGDFYLLDTSAVKDLSERNARGRVLAWNPDEAPVLGVDPDDVAMLGGMLAGAIHSPMNGSNGNGHNSTAPHSAYHSAMPAMADQDAEELAIEYFAAGLSQREVGKLIRERGLTIDQNEFPRLQAEGLKRRKGQ